MKTLLFALLLLGFAGSARAQYDECLQPSSVPEDLYDTVVDEASFDFGNLPDNVCNSITKKGVSTCKAGVKAQAKCYRRSGDAVYDIQVKQCNQLELAEDRAGCKAAAKDDRDSFRGIVDSDKEDGLDVCEAEFAAELSNSCMVGLP